MKDDSNKSTANMGGSPKTGGMKTSAEWARELKVKPHYLAGAAKPAGWADGQKISKSEFERKLNDWLKRPVGARK